MIQSITVTNYLGEQLKLELTRPELSGFIVMSVTGLGPVKANINTTETAMNDGSQFNSARADSRNIVISLRYLPNPTIEDTRQLSYRFFPVKKKLTLLIETDNRSLEIDGYVESNEPDIFSQEEGADISIICPFPFFHSPNDTITFFGSVDPLFEFPFSNESLTEPLLEFSEIKKNPVRDIVYTGDADTGITIRIHASGEIGNIVLYNLTTNETMRIDVEKIAAITQSSGLIARDEVVITTEKGNKSAVLIREGKSTNILNSIDRGSAWFQISKGPNTLAYATDSGQDNIQIEVQNKILYEGV